MATTWDAIFLGNGSGFDIDPIEGNIVSENASGLVGIVYGSALFPLYQNIVSVETHDNGNDGTLETNGLSPFASDTVTYTLPGTATPMTADFDGMGVYDATVTFLDNSTATITVVIFQDEAGNFFLAPETSANSDSAVLQSGPIRSIQLTGLITNDSNLTADRNAADFVTCFTAGTLIDTPGGLRPVEDLRVGDRVLTVDDGAQPLRWVGSRRLDVRAAESLKPIRIRAGALGQGLPVADLLVSQQHRMLVRSAIAQRMFGTNEVLVAAKQLVALPGIEVVQDAGEMIYVHLLFDRHQLVVANGAVSESLFTGPQALKGVSEAARAEILMLFPYLAEVGEDLEGPEPARPLIRGRRGRSLAERHLANRKMVFGRY